MTTRYVHRVTKKQARKAPPALPKEVLVTGPRERIDRWGVPYRVIWCGADKDVPPSQAGRGR